MDNLEVVTGLYRHLKGKGWQSVPVMAAAIGATPDRVQSALHTMDGVEENDGVFRLTPQTTVGELIAALQGIDPKLPVYVYDETSEEWAGYLKVLTGTEFPYTKCDPPETDGEPFALIAGIQA